MVAFRDGQIFIDETPVFILSGEMHYFRQPKENWQHLIDEAKEMGLNCISSYVPWILHEEKEGDYCFEDTLDLGAFIDLCKENGLYFFVRPGPYIMAEMKKEGIPYWVAKKHPDAVPVGFDGEQRPCNNIDYLNPGYLQECRKWYEKVMEIIVPRLQCNGGNIIGIQLDNEIGMLNWVTNHPLLNDHVLEMLEQYLAEHYEQQELEQRYPFWTRERSERFAAMRSPEESYAVEFHLDFGKFMRKYYAQYVRELKSYAEEFGVRDTPFFINIHGTGSSRIFDFPLGISQLYEAYNQGDGLISGTDVYLGEPTEGKYQDLYVINAWTDAMNKKGNPLTSIEFECSDAPYCSLNGMRFHPSATSHKMLMCLSQNARMLSFYVFSGGENYFLRYPEEDGNGRMAFTSELHGFNAPVQPDGTRNYSFRYIADTAKTIHALNKLIASSRQVLDPVSLAFIPDYFLTEAQYPKSNRTAEIYENLKRLRCEGQIDNIVRALLGHHISFGGLDIQNEEIPQDKILVVLSARYMAADVQKKLADFAQSGGKILLYGEVPEYDMEGRTCTVLKNLMNLQETYYVKHTGPVYYPSMQACNEMQGIAPMQCGDYVQAFRKDQDAILELYGSGKMCGMIRHIGKGIICAVTGDYPSQMQFWGRVFEKLGIQPHLKIDYYRQGIYAAQTESPDGQKLLYLMNLDCVEKKITVAVSGETVFEDFVLTDKMSLILPLGVKTPAAMVKKSTAEIVEMDESSITFRCSQPKDMIVLSSGREVLPGIDCEIRKMDGDTILYFSERPGREVCVKFV